MAAMHSHMGRATEPVNFAQAESTPDFQYYADDDEDGFTGNPDEIEDVEIPTPEAQDNYVGVSLELPFGDGLAQGRVTKRARDNDGNVIGWAHDNPILDTRRYVVAFENGEEAELSANAIAQSMYAQCDPGGNQCVLFDSIVDYRKSTTALTKADKKVVKANGRTFLRRSSKGRQLCV